AFAPTQLLQSLHDCSNASLRDRLVGAKRHGKTDPPQPLGLLGTRDARPGGRRAAPKGNEFSPLHLHPPPTITTPKCQMMMSHGRSGDCCIATCQFRNGSWPCQTLGHAERIE